MKFNLKSHAKINLALNVTGKNKSLHKIESIISFIDLHDVISIKKTIIEKHKISFRGKFAKGIGKKNTVQKLFQILDREKLLQNQKFRVSITKNIPQKAGLGGGSINAASILNFLNKTKVIKISKKKILKVCSEIGSDVFLGIEPSSSVLLSNNKIKKFSNCSILNILLIKPNFGCATKKIYSNVRKFTKPKFNNPNKSMFDYKFLKNQRNALEDVAFSKYPQLKKIKLFLEKTNNPQFVRMTGSGSTVIAFYQSVKDCNLAKVQFKRKFNNCWLNVSKTI
jgi:4-diphosphocytidyl-2-C-methyl-D-erythritol kinase